MNQRKYDWINSMLSHFPNAAKDVLTFIADITFKSGFEPIHAIESLFANGYCYYFALMLKDAFNGEIMWSKGRSHIVWMDTRHGDGYGMAYDVYGVYEDYDELVGISHLKSDLESFRHRGHDQDISLEVEEYKIDNHLTENELNEKVFSIIPDNEKTFEYPNLGDTYRYWEEFKKVG